MDAQDLNSEAQESLTAAKPPRRLLPRWFPKQPAKYWITSGVILLVSIWAKPFIDSRLNLFDVRNWIFSVLTQSSTNPSLPRYLKVVMIGDDDFWSPALQHRIPTDRSYLAKVVRALDQADASVIALDFDLRLPRPRPSVAPGDYLAVDDFKPYRTETDDLVRAIDDVARRRHIVLSKTMQGPLNGPFTFQADAYQPYGICSSLKADGRWNNPGPAQFPISEDAKKQISCGYIALMPDKRRLPPPVAIAHERGKLDSFPLAVVRAKDPMAATRSDFGSDYASFIPPAAMKNGQVVISAHRLLADPAGARSIIQGWPVIVGAGWNQRAYGSGGLVDLHDTPLGKVSGALLHENLAEAILSGRTYPSVPEWMVVFLEVLVGLGAAIWFAAIHSWWKRSAAVASAMAVLFTMQWLSLQLFGIFIDAFVPVLGLGIHALGDKIFEGGAKRA